MYRDLGSCGGAVLLDGDHVDHREFSTMLTELGPFVPQAIAGIREHALRWSQQELADKVSGQLAASSNPDLSKLRVDKSTICKIEKGTRRLEVDVFFAICEAMSITLRHIEVYASALRKFSEAVTHGDGNEARDDKAQRELILGAVDKALRSTKRKKR